MRTEASVAEAVGAHRSLGADVAAEAAVLGGKAQIDLAAILLDPIAVTKARVTRAEATLPAPAPTGGVRGAADHATRTTVPHVF